MSLEVISWRLAEIMARYQITGISLATELDMTPKAVSHLRRCRTMPRLDGDALYKLCSALSKLAGKQIKPSDLIELEVGVGDFVRTA